MTTLNDIIFGFAPITLKDMDAVSLLKRTDTKFVFSKAELIEILPKIQEHYYVLDVDGVRLALYDTIYWDTPDFKFYLDHHNGKPDRYKVRMRKYVHSNLCFLEVKHKIKGKTDKKRIVIDDFEHPMSGASKAFVFNILKGEVELEVKSRNIFNRITLVSKTDKERLTLDTGLQFEVGNHKVELPHIVIGEVKQERINRNSVFMQLLKKYTIRTENVSKYCLGNSMLYPTIKYNKFKSKIRKVNGINDGLVA